MENHLTASRDPKDFELYKDSLGMTPAATKTKSLIGNRFQR
jgi:hypothetical protein